jgi:hypothetical protein
MAENLTLIFEMVGTDASGMLIDDSAVEDFRVSKNNKRVAMNEPMFPFCKTEYIFEIDHDTFDKRREVPSP